jgi:hypothetical protein
MDVPTAIVAAFLVSSCEVELWHTHELHFVLWYRMLHWSLWRDFKFRCCTHCLGFGVGQKVGLSTQPGNAERPLWSRLTHGRKIRHRSSPTGGHRFSATRPQLNLRRSPCCLSGISARFLQGSSIHYNAIILVEWLVSFLIFIQILFKMFLPPGTSAALGLFSEEDRQWQI